MRENTIYTVFQQAASNVPQQLAVVDSAKRITYEQLLVETDQLANALVASGVEAGRRIILALHNRIEYIQFLLAANKLGATVVPVGTQLKTHHIQRLVQEIDPVLVVVENDAYLPVLQNAQRQKLFSIVLLDDRADGTLSYMELLQKSAVAQKEPVVFSEATAFVLFSSGTAGKARPICLSNANVLASANIAVAHLQASKRDAFLVAMPSYHVFTLVPTILAALISGAKLVLQAKFKATTALQQIEQEKITIHNGVPMMFMLELNSLQNESRDLSSLRIGIIGGAPCPEEILRKISFKMGMQTIIGYGLTETTSIFSYTDVHDPFYKQAVTVGRVAKGYEVQIVGPNQERLANGEIGELLCRGPGVMQGYFNRTDFTGGWLATGDLASIDEDGYIRLYGRVEDAMNHSHKRMTFKELEERLYEFDAVQQAAVVPMIDEQIGEQICAFIKLKFGFEQTESLTIQMRNDVMLKEIDHLIVVDQLPMTASGKVNRPKLKQLYTAEIQ